MSEIRGLGIKTGIIDDDPFASMSEEEIEEMLEALSPMANKEEEND